MLISAYKHIKLPADPFSLLPDSMNSHLSSPIVLPRCRPVRQTFLRGVVAILTGVAWAASPLHAGSINIPNYSFEGPVVPSDSTTGVISGFDFWQMTPEAQYFQFLPPEATFGRPWQAFSGVFKDVPDDPTLHISNIDGTQAALLFGLPEMGIFQTLSSVYQVGQAYHLTIGLVGLGGGMEEGVPFGIQLYYLDGSNKVIIDTKTVLHTPENFSSHTYAEQFTLDLAPVQASDAWAGKSIGIQLMSMSEFNNPNYQPGGYWDIDNVRLTETPEPGSAVLLLLGGLAILQRRARARTRRA